MVNDPAAQGGQGAAVSPPKRYRVSFFRPTTPYARANMKMIIVMVLIWAIAVFGFQIALMVLNKDVPEPALAQFENTWPVVVEDAGVATETKQAFARSLLMVLGKNIAVSDADKATLSEALSWTVYDQLDAAEREAVDGHVAELAALADLPADTPPDSEVVAGHQKQIRALVAANLGLEDSGFDSLMADLLPFSLMASNNAAFGEAVQEALPGVMRKYLIHHRSALTDFRFMGFPFHYWYTAQFLLIMFVGLCCVYAIVTDRLHHRYGLVDE